MKRRTLGAALAPFALLLVACGGTTEAGDVSSTPETSASKDCADDTTSTSTGPVELTDGLGRTVKLDKPATRVAVLEWQQIEDVLTLCVNPVAAADVKGYNLWDTAEELPAETVDVGTRG